MPVVGRLDAHGCLIEADPRLLALQRAAGGVLGGALAVPQLAHVAHMAQSLGLEVARTVIAADADDDAELHVVATPDASGVTLTIGDWRALARMTRRFTATASPGARVWTWSATPDLILHDLNGPAGDEGAGHRLSAFFKLEPDATGDLPMIAGLAQRQRFSAQPARVAHSAEPVQLAALPLYDAAGHFLGWRGTAVTSALVTRTTDPATTLAPATPRRDSAADGYTAQLTTALRAPLEAIIHSADDIGGARDGVSAAYSGYASDIAAAGRHLLGLVDDLRDAQSIEAPDFRVDKDPVDIADVARRAANLLRVRAADQAVKIDAPSEHDVVLAAADFRRVLQILVNLLSNAVRYSPRGGQIWIRTEREGDLVALIVSDQGKGIAQDAADFIFEKFARIDPNEPGGTGLGLYISRKLARAMGGDISVSSAPGMGARFILTLPAAT